MKKTLLCLCLCACLLLSSCWMPSLYERIDELESLLEATQTQPTDPAESTEPHSPTESERPTLPTTEEAEGGEEGTEEELDLRKYVPYEDFPRLYEPFLEERSFSEIQYERPDVEALVKAYGDVQTMVEEEKDVEDIVSAYEAVFEEHTYFDTMNSLAYIRYSLDLSDSYYDEEYNWCEEQSPLLNQAQEKCFVAMSESPLRSALEEAYFEEGFFEFYDENRIYSKDEVVALMQQEADIQAQYMALQDRMTVFWKGEERSVDELLEDPKLPYEDYLNVYRAYYNKYNPLCADLFVKLIKVRKEIAKELELDSYADYAYTYTYARDYTPQQVQEYCDSIADEMVSLLFPAVMVQGSLPSKDLEAAVGLFTQTMKELGGVFHTAYDYMEAYDLWDTTASASKLPGSYVTYLTSYEMPFLYVTPTGTLSDFLTVCHEFGHFVDGYVNNGGFDGVDCAEVFSQGLEFIALDKADLNSWEKNTLKRSKAADSVMVFLSQACYAEFEHLAYSLPENKLNAQGLNELYQQCNEKYGMSSLYMGMEDLLTPGWIDVQHFFIAPYYVISYCVSNDAALQLYQQELSHGNALDSYFDLLLQPTDSTLLELLEGAEMESPFAEKRMKTLADFLEDQLQ